MLNAAQAQAFLGIGEKSAEEVYKEDTVRRSACMACGVVPHDGSHMAAVITMHPMITHAYVCSGHHPEGRGGSPGAGQG